MVAGWSIDWFDDGLLSMLSQVNCLTSSLRSVGELSSDASGIGLILLPLLSTWQYLLVSTWLQDDLGEIGMVYCCSLSTDVIIFSGFVVGIACRLGPTNLSTRAVSSLLSVGEAMSYDGDSRALLVLDVLV